MQYIDILDVNIYHLQLFIYTVECGSMTKAANLAHVSQSMLSKTISKLEQKFGLQLFVRKNNGLSVTSAGEILYDESVKLKGSLELALEKAHLAQEARRLPIRIVNSGLKKDPLQKSGK